MLTRKQSATENAAQQAAVADAAAQPEIGAFLKAGIGLIAFAIYCWRRS
jgi:hypothetical protein